MELTEQQMFDYIYCPALYDFKYNKNVVLEKPKKISDLVNQVCNYFFMYIIEFKKVPSLAMLSNKYEKLYLKDKELFDDSKYTSGLFLLRNFYNWACQEKLTPFSPNMPFALTIDDIKINGYTNPIIVNINSKTFEFLFLKYNNRLLDTNDLDKKLKFSLDCLAFNQNPDYKINVIKVKNIRNNKEYITSRNNNDYKRIKSTIKNISNGIKNKVFYPSEGIKCKDCPYKYYCKAWN